MISLMTGAATFAHLSHSCAGTFELLYANPVTGYFASWAFDAEMAPMSTPAFSVSFTCSFAHDVIRNIPMITVITIVSFFILTLLLYDNKESYRH